MAKIVRAISDMGGVVITVIDSTDIVKRMEEIHQTSAVVSAAFGRLLTASQLMAANLKSVDDSITMRIKADGPIGLLTVACDGRGNCKGYVENNVVEIPLRADGKLDVGGGVGQNGYLSVVKDLRLKEPYIGQVPIQTGEVGDDLAFYFAQSEQVPSLVALGVLVDRDYSVKQAGGFIVQIMPDCDEFNLKKFEKAAEKITSVTSMLEKGLSNEELIKEVMKDFEVDILDEIDVDYVCDCCDERMQRAIVSLGKKEIQDIIDEQGEAEIVCQFCDKAYRYGKEALEEMLERAKR